MIKVLIGNLLGSQAQTLMNTVNCVGVMGKGIALEFKKRFPDMFAEYAEKCHRGEVKLGRPYLYQSLAPPYILNFPTKDHWRSLANLAEIIRGLDYLMAHYKEWGITSIAVPPLGCGNGQLEWRVVGPTLYRHFSRMDIPVELYAPYGTPHRELQAEFLGDVLTPDRSEAMPEPKWIKPSWVALVEILSRIEGQPYHHLIGRTIFQKIAYVATAEGLPTDLTFRKNSYGPYCSDLKGVTSRLTNNGLIVERRAGRAFEVLIGETFPDARKAYMTELQAWERIIEKTTDLFLRLDTRRAEIVATVIFATQELTHESRTKPHETDVLRAVMDWKMSLHRAEVAVTIRSLGMLSWLDIEVSDDLPVQEEELLGV